MGTGRPVHTGVVYIHGGPPGLVWNQHEEESFGRVPCTFRFSSLGVSRASARSYLNRPEPLAWALAVLMRPSGVGSRAELAVACLRRILDSAELGEDRRLRLLNFVHTYAKLDPWTAPEYQRLLRVAENEEVREMMMTWADEIRAEGIEKGRAQGRQQGVEEGIEKGIERMRDVVLDLVATRFGDLSERSRRAIAAIKSLDELAELAKRAARVKSLEELRIG